MNGRPDLVRSIQHDQTHLLATLDRLIEKAESTDRDRFLEQHQRFVRGVRGVLLDFIAHAFVRGPELRTRFDDLFGPSRIEPLRTAPDDALAAAARRLRSKLEAGCRLVADEIVPLLVGLLEENELAAIAHDYREAHDRAAEPGQLT